MTLLTVRERLESRLIETKDGCLEWTGAKHRQGYGHIRVEGKVTFTHRLAWQLSFGAIPSNLFVCHSCDNPPCCNVAHLWLGTNLENQRDMHSKGRGNRSGKFNAVKTHCPQGHSYSGENLYISPRKGRVCITCMHTSGQKYRDRKREKVTV